LVSTARFNDSIECTDFNEHRKAGAHAQCRKCEPEVGPKTIENFV